MIIFPLVIVFSLIAFVYFKVFQSRGYGPAQRQLYGAKASISLGIFVLSFGVNAYINYQTTTAAVIGLIFTALGAANIYFGSRQHRYFSPLAKEEKQQTA
ncbi:YtpI family protein [Bacillus daqingensis]|uniref:YtpI family protein n=1 Tax=Bacillus daqingensis TaxID=872396 RepID=A0ABV9NXU7_9BACI